MVHLVVSCVQELTAFQDFQKQLVLQMLLLLNLLLDCFKLKLVNSANSKLLFKHDFYVFALSSRVVL